jgi:hypothetical protein
MAVGVLFARNRPRHRSLARLVTNQEKHCRCTVLHGPHEHHSAALHMVVRTVPARGSTARADAWQNWANECNKFTPDLKFFKLDGNAAQRRELFSRQDVHYAECATQPRRACMHACERSSMMPAARLTRLDAWRA